jgi:hypothetical protein
MLIKLIDRLCIYAPLSRSRMTTPSRGKRKWAVGRQRVGEEKGWGTYMGIPATGRRPTSSADQMGRRLFGSKRRNDTQRPHTAPRVHRMASRTTVNYRTHGSRTLHIGDTAIDDTSRSLNDYGQNGRRTVQAVHKLRPSSAWCRCRSVGQRTTGSWRMIAN